MRPQVKGRYGRRDVPCLPGGVPPGLARERRAVPDRSDGDGQIEVVPVVVLSQTFPARPSWIPEIRDFVRRCLAESPLTEDGNREVGETVFRALLDAAEPTRQATFADWMSSTLRREGLTHEAAARQLGVSVKTVGRWVGGETEPRMRDLRRIQELFGELPFP